MPSELLQDTNDYAGKISGSKLSKPHRQSMRPFSRKVASIHAPRHLLIQQLASMLHSIEPRGQSPSSGAPSELLCRACAAPRACTSEGRGHANGSRHNKKATSTIISIVSVVISQLSQDSG
jgi:hypothetical protein